MTYSVVIIGYGTVGKNLNNELKRLDCDHIDKYTKNDLNRSERHNLGFICVDTPRNDETLDTTEVWNAIRENDCDIYVVKSTVPVGTCDAIKAVTGKRVVFSPEYYGGTQHCNNFDFSFTILGGDHEDCIAVQQILQKAYDARHKFALTDTKTAEMAKFMENAWLATKVTFCCEFYRACEKAQIKYEDLRELFVLDPRVNPSHTFVYRDKPKWDSHCLNKDVPSIAEQYNIEILKDIIEINKKY